MTNGEFMSADNKPFMKISSVITGKSAFDPKKAQNLQALVVAAVKAVDGSLAFVCHDNKLGPEAKALTDSMISIADQIKHESPLSQSTTPIPN